MLIDDKGLFAAWQRLWPPRSGANLRRERLMRLDDFDYCLPPELIAQEPPLERGQSRLLVVTSAALGNCADAARGVRGAALVDTEFAQLARWLKPGDLLVLNDTRVIKARLRGRKPSGGQVEIFVERSVGPAEFLAQVRTGSTLARRYPHCY